MSQVKSRMEAHHWVKSLKLHAMEVPACSRTRVKVSNRITFPLQRTEPAGHGAISSVKHADKCREGELFLISIISGNP